MLTQYVKAALKQAKYKIIEDENLYFGEIPVLPGVWANGKTLEECRDELEEVVEDWMLVSLRRGYEIPIIDGIDLSPKKELIDIEADK